MYCTKCGNQVDDTDKFCPNCGTNTNGDASSNMNNQYQGEIDAPNSGFAILSGFIPFIGLILYFIWKDKYPLKANSCLKGFLIGIVFDVVIICCIISVIPAGFYRYYYYIILRLL